MAPQMPDGGRALEGRTAIVTGAGRGIGRAIALAFAGEGARVVLVSRTAAQLEETATMIDAIGGQSIVVPIDVDAEGAPAIALEAAAAFGSVDILMFGAGVSVTRPAFDVTRDEWDQVMGPNLRAAFFWAQACGKVMAQGDGGSIVFLASVLGQVGTQWLAPYSATKGGMLALMRALSVEWGRDRIRVNAITSGFVSTELTEKEFSNERFAKRITGRAPLGRFGDSAEIADAAIFLASNRSAYVTGHALAVDGGWLAS